VKYDAAAIHAVNHIAAPSPPSTEPTRDSSTQANPSTRLGHCVFKHTPEHTNRGAARSVLHANAKPVMSPTILFHTICGLVALAAGAIVVGARKGTLFHRVTGWIYVGSMALLCGTSFLIYELFKSFGPFHAAAIVSSLSIIGGIAAPLLRSRLGDAWLEAHYKFMLWSYVGLVMATGSHFFEVLGPWFSRATPLNAIGSLIATVIVCWILPLAVGGALIYGRKSAILARVQSRLEERRSRAVSE